jgi:glutathione S-transferase
MKLYSIDLSPFASAVRIAIYANALPIEIVSPPESGTRSSEYLAINPIGKVPALVLDNGTVIPESVIILEYLAATYPQAGILPADPEQAARTRLISRIGEIYMMIPSSLLFAQMNPAERNAAVVAGAFENMFQGLAHLNTFLGEDGFAAGPKLSMADCTMIPMLFFMGVLGMAFERGDVTAQHPKVAAYWARVQKDPVVAKVLGEMQEALKVMQARMAAPQPA